MTSATPTHLRAYNGQGPPTSECFSQLKTAYSARNGAPKRQGSLIYTHLCRNAQASADQGLSTATQDNCHVHGTPCWNSPPSPYPTFLLAQNLSSKRIAPTDNMRPNLHDECTRHQWLKSYCSLIPRLFHRPIFDRLQYAKTGWWEGLQPVYISMEQLQTGSRNGS